MSNKIYGGVSGIELPDWKPGDFKEYQKNCDKYLNDIKAYCKKHGKGKYAGEVIQFQVADGYAEYVVLSLRPVQLIHIETMDGYHEPMVSYISAEGIKKNIDSRKALEKIFSKQK